MCISNNQHNIEMLSDEEISKYNVLIGHTPFSFFRDFSHPVVIFDYYKNYALKLINDVCSRINQVFETSFDYLVNPEVNAGCFYADGKNRIVVYEGTILLIYAYASILSCNYHTINILLPRNIDRTIHNVEINMQYKNYPTITTKLKISNIIEENIIAEYIAMIAVKLVICHEIGHILGGHLVFLQRHGEKRASFYMSQNSCTSIDPLDLQAMEIDADSFAICHLLSLLEIELLNDPLLLGIVTNKSEVYKLVGCAVQCVFYLLEENRNPKSKDDHPSPMTRVNLMLDTCHDTISANYSDEGFHSIVNGIILAQKHFCDYFNTSFEDPEQFVFDVLGENEQGKAILDRWRNLKCELSKLTTLPFV